MNTEQDFERKYTANKNIISNEFDSMEEGQEGRLETFGEDFELVQKIHKENPRTIWTVIEGDEGRYWSAGFHYVNSEEYFISNENWENNSEEYIFDVC